MTLFATLFRFTGFGPASKTPLSRLLRVSKQRRDLLSLTQEQLCDIGVTRAEAEAEAKRPFWDAPNFWRN